MIPVTKPFLPSLDQYQSYVEDIWKRNWLTNNGPLVSELEEKLRTFLGVPGLLFTANGTVALQMAIRALKMKGEVITTPFSYVATTSSIVWQNCKPVMVDICPKTLNIDPEQIERSITARTTGIVATHVFGNACDIDAIDAIARRHGLKVIYDAAHCFGTTYRGRSIYAYGDVATASFHATKLFHTIEGGAVFAADPDMLAQLSLCRNFGHTSATSFGGVGINGKNSELHAAMGLCNLAHVPAILANRRRLVERYTQELYEAPLRRQEVTVGCQHNDAYFPVIFQSETTLLDAVGELQRHGIYPRRYFFPSLDTLDYIVGGAVMPVSRDIASRILCLPLYHDLSLETVGLVCRVLRSVLGGHATPTTTVPLRVVA